MATIYLGHLTGDAEEEFRRRLPENTKFSLDPELMIGIIELPDLAVAQHLAQALDGLLLNGQTITAIERNRLETAIDAARSPRSNVIIAALATRLRLIDREEQNCLKRLVRLLGIAVVVQAADRAQDKDALFDHLLRQFHPIVAHALRCGSLRQAEGLRRITGRHRICSPIVDPVELELQRRKEVQRQARRDLSRVQKAGVTGLTLTRATEKVREADRNIDAFLERFDMAVRVHVQTTSPSSRPKAISVPLLT